MTIRRGWQIASVAGLWLSYGGFVLWPTIYDHVGNRAYLLPLLLIIALLGGATVAAWRAIAARRPRLTHWETRMPIESLFLMLLAPDLFALDLLVAVASQRSLADAPFAQVGWVVLVFFCVAALLAFVGALSYGALRTPPPVHHSHRDVVSSPPNAVTSTTSEPQTNMSLVNQISANLTRNEASGQLRAIIIGCLAIPLFLLLIPYGIGGLLSTVSFSWLLWQNVAVFPATNGSGTRRYVAQSTLFIFIAYLGIFYFRIETETQFQVHDLLMLRSVLIFYELVLINFLLTIGNEWRIWNKEQLQRTPELISSVTQLRWVTLAFPVPSFLSSGINPFTLLLFIVAMILLFAFLGVFIVASIRALQSSSTPAQSEVA